MNSVRQVEHEDHDHHFIQLVIAWSSILYNEVYKVLQVAVAALSIQCIWNWIWRLLVDEYEDANDGNIDEFDRVDIFEDVDDMHDKNTFEIEK